jgi:hypothetical protein
MQIPNYNSNIFVDAVSSALRTVQSVFVATTQAQRNAIQQVIAAFSTK